MKKLIDTLEATLSDLFCGGEHQCREVRLSDPEYSYLATMYPNFTLTPMGESGEKTWYSISRNEAQ